MKKNSITLNVLSDITKKIKTGSTLDNTGKKALVILTGSNTDTIRKINEIKDLKEKGYEIDIAFSFMSGNILDIEKIISILNPVKIFSEEDVFDFDNIVKDYSFLIGPNLTINTISKVATGMIDSFISTILWSFLYDSKDVYLDYSNVRELLGRKTKNNKIMSIIDKNINILKEMGAKEITLGNYLNTICGSEINNKDIKEKLTLKNKIITNSDIEKLSKGDILKVYKNDIITDLAVDTAKKIGVIIEKI